jgi:hypothetical protein
MEKAEVIQKTVETLTPFETANIVDFLRHVTVKQAITNPWFVGLFLVIAFYAVIKRSKFVLGALFTTASLLIIFHFTMPVEGEGLSLSSTLPFAFGGIAVGAVLIYMNFIKTE